jgi:hypothetical protein
MKTLKEQYAALSLAHPLMAPHVRGFLMFDSAYYTGWIVRTEEQWQINIEKGFTIVEPYFGLKIPGSVLLSSFEQSKELGITPEQCLDMGYDPNVIFRREQTNALHFAVFHHRWDLVKRLVVNHNMSLAKPDGKGKPSFYYCNRTQLPVEFLDWLKLRPDFDAIVEANLDCLTLRNEFRRLNTENLLKKEKEKEVKDKLDKEKMIEELTEKVKQLESQVMKQSLSVAAAADPIVAFRNASLLVPSPSVPSPSVPLPAVPSPLPPQEKEKEYTTSVKLQYLLDTILISRLYFKNDEQMMQWFTQLDAIIESKEDHPETKLLKIRSSFQAAAMYITCPKNINWMKNNQI